MRRILRVMFELEDDFTVAEAADARAALAEVSRTRPDIVIVDRHLAGGDGFGLVRRLRSDGYDEPVVVCSAEPAAEAEALAVEAGATAYVPKTANLLELVSVARVLIARARAHRSDGPEELRGRSTQ